MSNVIMSSLHLLIITTSLRRASALPPLCYGAVIRGLSKKSPFLLLLYLYLLWTHVYQLWQTCTTWNKITKFSRTFEHQFFRFKLAKVAEENQWILNSTVVWKWVVGLAGLPVFILRALHDESWWLYGVWNCEDEITVAYNKHVIKQRRFHY